jgi:type II secretion system protein N
MAIHLGPRVRRVLRYVGFVLLALVTFVFALQLTFPYNRVKDKIIEALSTKYEVSIGDVERGIMPGRMYFKAVTLRTRPEKSDDAVNTFYVERLEVDLGLLALIKGTASVDIDAKIGPGHITGNIAISQSLTSIDLEGTDLPSAMLPMREAMGLPMSGKIAFAFALDLPNEKSKIGKTAPNWQKAEGAVAFDCLSGCTFGDGKTKLKPKLKNARSQAFASDGIEFGKVNVDSMVARVSIKGGKMELTRFDAKSQDGELKVDFEATLAPVFSDSMVAGCLRFHGSESLQKREPKTAAAISTTGANLGPDGLFHIRLDGKFRDMKRLAQNCGPAVNNIQMDNPGGGGGDSRPNLTVQHADETLTKSATPPTPVAPVTIDAGAEAPPTPPVTTTVPINPEGAQGSAAGSGMITPTPPGEPLPPGAGPSAPNGAGSADGTTPSH